MRYQAVRLEHKHLEEAARLVSRRYAKLHRDIPILPTQYTEIDTLLPLLTDILTAGPGVALLDGASLAGFAAGYLLDEFLGRPAVFSPEWANAALPEDTTQVYEMLYTHIAPQWLDGGYPTHLVSLLSNDRVGIEGLHWLGFGKVAADGIRSLEPVPELGTQWDIRKAKPVPDDIQAVMVLDTALNQHLAASPTFFPHGEGRDWDYYANRVNDPANAFWLAFMDDQPVASIAFGPASQEACTIIVDRGTTSISSAFTLPDMRRTGIATRLLNIGLEWARAQGYQRCAVDFEAANPLAAHYWLRNFHLVCVTLMRSLIT